MSTTFSTEADARQHAEISARNINKILSDAAAGTAPLATTAAVTSNTTAEATSAAPTYTEGQDAPLSQDLSGNLRVIPAGATRTPAITTANGNGSVAAGKRFVQFIFSSDFTGTVLGATFAGSVDAVYELPVLPNNDTYAAVAYTIGTGSARITSF